MDIGFLISSMRSPNLPMVMPAQDFHSGAARTFTTQVTVPSPVTGYPTLLFKSTGMQRSSHEDEKPEEEKKRGPSLSPTRKEAFPQVSPSDGIETVLKTMRKFSNVDSVQKQGCEALAQIARGISDNKASIVQPGGVDAVLSSMTTHPQCELVQASACMALSQMLNMPDNTASAVKLVCVDAVMESMRLHLRSALVQESACHALRVIAPRDSNKEQLGGQTCSGVIELVVQAMRSHASVIAVQTEGAWVLGNFASACRSNQDLIVHAGGIEAIMKALSISKVHRRVCLTLKDVLDNNPDAQMKFTLTGDRKKFEAFEEATSNAATKKAALDVLNLLSQAPDARARSRTV